MNMSRRRFFAYSCLTAIAAGTTLAHGVVQKKRTITVSFFPGSESLQVGKLKSN